MKPDWFDISVPVAPGKTPIWPGSPSIRLDRRLDLERGDRCTDSTLRCSVHTGTHVDAPAHVLHGGPTVDSISLDTLMGPCRVVDLRGKDRIVAADFEALGISESPERLLLQTDNSMSWSSEFRHDFVGLSTDAASWLANLNIALLGIDYLSVQPFGGNDDVHRTLLSAGVLLLEGLNLSGITAGIYELCCLPVRIQGAEAAPARACLRLPHDAQKEQTTALRRRGHR